tara:strand:+ start:16681 stop:17838 length:1158 start_codon:yes stop_codon:yes gene_type:complete
MNIYYWCPFLSKVATVQAVLNSAISLKKYSKNQISPHIINAVGEWGQFKNIIREKNIGLVNFINSDFVYKSLPRFSYLKSRFSYFLICILSFSKLYSFLKQRKKEDVFIIHLISSLPLILILFFNFKCKFVLRISGYPQLNMFRKLLWKLCKNKISLVLCPTIATKNNLVSQNLFRPNSHYILYDPILEIEKFNKLKKEKIPESLKQKKFILNIGRLTHQKNQIFLIKNFKEILKNYPDLYLVILGEGELESHLKKISRKFNIYDKIIFIGYDDNVYKYLNNAEFFVLTSKWEDPGFVLIEAALSRAVIISSDCPNGPKEILNHGTAGFLFKSDDRDSFLGNFKKAKNETVQNLKMKKILALKNSKNYTIYRHFLSLQSILKSSI